jgi:hypothetical protein
VTLRARIASRLARTRFAQRAIAEQADLSPFRERPSLRLVLGVGLIGLAMLGGWPVVALTGIVALYTGEPLVFVIGGPAAYGISWVIWAVGMVLAGAENIKYGGIFLRWAVRRFVEKHGGGEAARAALSDDDGLG